MKQEKKTFYLSASMELSITYGIKTFEALGKVKIIKNFNFFQIMKTLAIARMLLLLSVSVEAIRWMPVTAPRLGSLGPSGFAVEFAGKRCVAYCWWRFGHCRRICNLSGRSPSKKSFVKKMKAHK